MCCWSLLTSHLSGSKSGLAVGPLMLHYMAFVFHNSPQLIPRMEGYSGCKDKRRTEGSGEGDGGWTVVWWEDQTHCHVRKNEKTNQRKKRKRRKRHPLHPPHPEPCIPTAFLSPLCSTREGQTSTDWIWFICARIIWTLLRIFFWWPANVTPTLRMSLWGETHKKQNKMEYKNI